MKQFTYRDLLDLLSLMSDKDLDSEVTILSLDALEFLPATELMYADHTDTLDEGHPYLLV